MISKFAPRREKYLIEKSEIKEPIRLISYTDDYYITPSGMVYREYPNGFMPRKPYLNKRNGYLYITIVIKSGKKKTYRLHRLVAEAWLPNPDQLPVVGHKNNDKANPHVNNLYWTTNAENIQKAVNDGLLKNDIGYADSQSRPVIVYDKDFNEIARFGSACECHKALGISKSTITRHCKNQIKTKTRTGYYIRYQDT